MNKLLISFSVLALASLVTYGYINPPQKLASGKEVLTENGDLILPWGDLGQKLVQSGVLDASKLEELYAQRGGLTQDEKDMLYGAPATITVTEANAGFVLNLLWAAGLGNKNEILSAEMSNPKYGGVQNFASTGGWSLMSGKMMDHYSAHNFITLTPTQQNLVDRVSRNVYRPCCGNSTHFPDCNHGMAMLGMLEVLAANGAGEKDLYSAALAANTLWFPEQYANIRNYFAKENLPQDPKTMVGYNVASGAGYQNVLSKVQPVQPKGGQGCGV